MTQEWKAVYKKKCDAAQRLIYADWLEERGDSVAAAGWRMLAHMQPCYCPKERWGGGYKWTMDHWEDEIGGHRLPKKWFKLLDGYTKKRKSLWSDPQKIYKTKYDAFDALAMVIGECVLGK